MCVCLFAGGSGEKDRLGLSESFLLMANSQRDTEEWVRAIQRAIWAPLGGGIFGQHLEETMQCESGCGSSSKTVVPLLVHQCVCFIHQHGLAEEGLFRMPGQTNHVRELQDAFDCGEKPLFDRFLDEVQSHCSQNMMSVQNLATVFGPNILRPKMEDAQTMKGTVVVQHLMTVLISEHSRLYQGEAETSREDQSAPPPTPYPHAPPIQHCMVEWLSQESPTNPTHREPLQPIPTSSGSSLDTDHPGSTTQGRKEGDSEGKSDGRTEGKMERKSEGKNERKLSGAVDMSTVTVGNWLMNGLSPFHSHRRTASTGKQLKESSLSLNETHKNSLPDSYTGSSLSIKYSSHSQRSSLKDSSPLHIDSSYSSIDSSFPNMKPSTSVKNSSHSNRLSTYDNVTITPCSLSLPGGSPSPWTSWVNEGLFSLVTELKEELRGQRFSYETRIRKLEESCSGLHLQSGRLEEDLNQEKKRFRMLEIRLGISKRARQDAETWNVLLQKEKEFWET
uniref:Rho GTPase activating protein 22 n=1 Tax=Hucho hucho TaxID=62062 RepID=A0A4W5QPE4_9TELE